jgi:F420-dependent oxidoreductase-like protein
MPHFGFQLPSFTFPGVPDAGLFERVAAIAGAAEDAGFDSFWVMDHYRQIPNIGPPNEPMLEAYTVLSGVAARTSRISLGALVTGVTYRNPAFLAKVVTTLDIVSSGRAILGIGAAWNDAESDAYGYDFSRTAERFDLLEDALQICRSMFRQPQSTVQGKVARVDGAWNVPQPVQPGGPKILIGGGGERKTLRLTARYADLWNGFGDAATVHHKLEVLREHCAAIGRDPQEVVTTRLGTLIVAETMATPGDASASGKRSAASPTGPSEPGCGGAARMRSAVRRRRCWTWASTASCSTCPRGHPRRTSGSPARPSHRSADRTRRPGNRLSPATELRGARSVVPQGPGFARLPWRACGRPQL